MRISERTDHLGNHGTHWGPDRAAAYLKAKHGPDGAEFLDKPVKRLLRNLSGKRVLDIGSGTGLWSRYIASQKGQVIALEPNEAMVLAADKENREAGYGEQIWSIRGDANNFPVKDGSVGIVLSSIVACNLPRLDDHFREAYRSLEPGGSFIVAVPNSFDRVFTTGGIKPEEVQGRLDAYYDQTAEPTLVGAAEAIKDVLQATLLKDDATGRLRVVTDISDFKDGEAHMRKIPGPIVANYYHHPDRYPELAGQFGFTVAVNEQLSFGSEEELAAYNKFHPGALLGPEYIGQPPFAVFEFVKPLEG